MCVCVCVGECPRQAPDAGVMSGGPGQYSGVACHSSPPDTMDGPVCS